MLLGIKKKYCLTLDSVHNYFNQNLNPELQSLGYFHITEMTLLLHQEVFFQDQEATGIALAVQKKM